VIPRNIRVAEAPSFGLPVIEHAPASAGSSAYRELAEELAVREEASDVSVSRLTPTPEVAADNTKAPLEGDGDA
jgi:nitrogenase subunit NifH